MMPAMIRYGHFGMTLIASAVFLWALFPLPPQVFAGSEMAHVMEMEREMVWLTSRFFLYIIALVCIWSHAMLRTASENKMKPPSTEGRI
jgi:hypothetical protein